MGVLIGAALATLTFLILSPVLGAFIGCTCFEDPQLTEDEDDDTYFGPVAKWGMNGDNQ